MRGRMTANLGTNPGSLMGSILGGLGSLIYYIYLLTCSSPGSEGMRGRKNRIYIIYIIYISSIFDDSYRIPLWSSPVGPMPYREGSIYTLIVKPGSSFGLEHGLWWGWWHG
ncbi:MAG: hypothetical protein QXR65_09475 [Candidatus Bathyarchaeia archaeon]